MAHQASSLAQFKGNFEAENYDICGEISEGSSNRAERSGLVRMASILSIEIKGSDFTQHDFRQLRQLSPRKTNTVTRNKTEQNPENNQISNFESNV